MIQAQAMAVRIACARMTMLHLTELHDSVERARGLAHMRAGDGEEAALEMERHLRALLYMWRLTLPGGQAIAGEAMT